MSRRWITKSSNTRLISSMLLFLLQETGGIRFVRRTRLSSLPALFLFRLISSSPSLSHLQESLPTELKFSMSLNDPPFFLTVQRTSSPTFNPSPLEARPPRRLRLPGFPRSFSGNRTSLSTRETITTQRTRDWTPTSLPRSGTCLESCGTEDGET